ncbi:MULTISPECIES: hypothetical protein [Halobacteriovorax]|uniref:Lipoprotein n=1 Tax=Halobacteriovorax vibrionivorans TaxID=2152716 RepID=A0ABY0IJJ4_9BACT|nr:MULTISPECIES: hypothetical protein [Halobacteriovorax]RZF23117.1 hypothetical protein DAY19_04940 [Halobacteriovorax vibrionivorans]TGD49251.1 hypothetical protein EP118_00140 [Halobacteriovorax sp. Y22]
MIRLACLLALLLTITSCSSGPKEREFELDYKVINASQKVEPVWLEDIKKYEGDSGYHYFLSQSENRNRRLCIKSATARSTAVIAAEVSQEISNDYTEVTSLDNDSEEVKTFYEKLTQTVRTKVSGVRVKEQYWEKRQKKSGEELTGSPYYACFSVVGIKEETLDRAKKAAQESAIVLAPSDKKEELREKFED